MQQLKSSGKVVAAALVSLPLVARSSPMAEQQKLVDENSAFAFDLMNQITQAKPEANVFISPFSVSSALQMLENGAAGKTKAEMEQALKTSGMSGPSLNEAYRHLNGQFDQRKDVILNLANGLWVQKGFRLKPAFEKVNQNFFQAELANVDFNDPQSARTINDWASEKTKGRIKGVVEYPFPPLTRLVLANAIYFKGKWIKTFEKHLTRSREFYLADGSTKKTPMMSQEGSFAYQETPDFQAVKLMYHGGLQMELYLPPTNSDPAKLLQSITADKDWQDKVESGFRPSEGTVVLPKFKMDYEIVLNQPLQALGMQSAFTPQADFSALASEPLTVSQVKQKSFVEVNEEGTEAAAVTTVTVRAMAVRMPSPNRFTMILDRPFLFIISDMETGSILFMGIVNDPSAKA